MSVPARSAAPPSTKADAWSDWLSSAAIAGIAGFTLYSSHNTDWAISGAFAAGWLARASLISIRKTKS